MGEKSIKQPLSKLIHVYVAGNSNQITKIDVLKLVIILGDQNNL